MVANETTPRRTKRAVRPLDEARLRDVALAYVARFSTTARKLERYLLRKLRERGWEGDEEPQVSELVARYVELGYIDDAAFARSRSDSLLRRGYGPRRVSQALGEAGIGEDIRENIRGSEAEGRRAALAMGRKRRFGPFGSEMPDADRRQKQLAAMLRAGHGFDAARAVVDAPTREAVHEWLAEAEDEENAG